MFELWTVIIERSQFLVKAATVIGVGEDAFDLRAFEVG